MIASYAYQQTSPILRVIIASNQEFIRPGFSGQELTLQIMPRRFLMIVPSLSSTVPGLFLVKRILAELPSFCNREPGREPGLQKVSEWDNPASDGCSAGFCLLAPSARPFPGSISRPGHAFRIRSK
jgi:hypothetical protein